MNIILDKMKQELDEPTDTMTQGMSAFVRVQILIFLTLTVIQHKTLLKRKVHIGVMSNIIDRFKS